ncbi:hypothetical protein POX_a00931 [Penicillium oxalicum]|uniref:Uncharacterized protein n=1 Tax=Penicillium oxalicum (strain 114-2 / CGMCC 5302) TaxID=933388 RepID=S8BG43_PENO1|nr:hypothetical protein POX_a00931 [Penicillium oxalicum]EPS34087.1 hypothetical protein PDE_09049 [Penicillium oxalicum 114-2]KAI2794335.1 hypothetical protein POX_a00931 [Penicillium oxalicum]
MDTRNLIHQPHTNSIARVQARHISSRTPVQNGAPALQENIMPIQPDQQAPSLWKSLGRDSPVIHIWMWLWEWASLFVFV